MQWPVAFLFFITDLLYFETLYYNVPMNLLAFVQVVLANLGPEVNLSMGPF